MSTALSVLQQLIVLAGNGDASVALCHLVLVESWLYCMSTNC
jgi:hypothetical protein